MAGALQWVPHDTRTRGCPRRRRSLDSARQHHSRIRLGRLPSLKSSLAVAQPGAIAHEPQSDQNVRVCLFHRGRSDRLAAHGCTVEGRSRPRNDPAPAPSGTLCTISTFCSGVLPPPQGGTQMTKAQSRTGTDRAELSPVVRAHSVVFHGDRAQRLQYRKGDGRGCLGRGRRDEQHRRRHRRGDRRGHVRASGGPARESSLAPVPAPATHATPTVNSAFVTGGRKRGVKDCPTGRSPSLRRGTDLPRAPRRIARLKTPSRM